MQRVGGVSRYFAELMRRDASSFCSVRYSDNAHLLSLPGVADKVLEPEHYLNRFLGGIRFKGKRTLFRSLCAVSGSDKRESNEDVSLKTISDRNYDLFHPTYYNPYFLEALGEKPFVLTVHDMIHELYPELFPLDDPVKEWKRELVSKASRIIAVSECTKRDLCEIFSVNPGNVRVIYHGSSLCIGAELPRGLPERYILYTGTRRGYKNFYFCAQSLAEVLRDRADLYLVCAGPLFAQDELSFLASLGIADKVVIVEVAEDQLSHLYNRAVCFIFPSFYEGFGIPILEAFEAGCPAVIAKASCFPEVAGDAAVYFDPKSRSELVGAIVEILDHESLRKEMADRGRERIKDFSWDITAARTRECYRELT